MKHYLHQLAVAIDQVLNALLGGWADETLSARAYRLSKNSYRWVLVRSFIDLVFFFENNHCAVAYESEQERRHLPVEYRSR